MLACPDGALGHFHIVEVTDTRVRISAPFVEEEKETGRWTGSIDRITGSLVINASRDGGGSYFIIYNLDCQPARQLF